MPKSMTVGNHSVPVDKEGFLKSLQDWSEEVAEQLALQEKIKLEKKHWEVLLVLKEFYSQTQVSPANRAFVNLIKRELGIDKGKSVYLMSLFGGSPAKIASKIAGLPKPDNCL